MNALEKLGHAAQMLAEVRSAKDAKKIVNMAAAAEYYAKKAKLGQEAIDYAHAIRIDALRLMGEFLTRAEKNKGVGAGIPGPGRGKPGTNREPGFTDAPPTLADLGVTKKESSEAQALAAIAEQDEELYEEIRNGETTVTAARRELAMTAVKETMGPAPAGKVRVLYADPPWKYNDGLTEDYGGARFHYPSMTVAELCGLCIEDLAISDLIEDDAVLFLWVTSPMLESAFPVLKAWGFTYKASFIWDKIKHNMGHYNSVRHEFLLICTRGSCLPEVSTLIDSVQSIERTEHSRKPEEFRGIIDCLYPSGRRLELFARGTLPTGWNGWGNQTE